MYVQSLPLFLEILRISNADRLRSTPFLAAKDQYRHMFSSFVTFDAFGNSTYHMYNIMTPPQLCTTGRALPCFFLRTTFTYRTSYSFLARSGHKRIILSMQDQRLFARSLSVTGTLQATKWNCHQNNSYPISVGVELIALIMFPNKNSIIAVVLPWQRSLH